MARTRERKGVEPARRRARHAAQVLDGIHIACATDGSAKTKPTATRSPAGYLRLPNATLTKPATSSTSPYAKSRRATSSSPSATPASPRPASRAPIATRARSRRSSARPAPLGSDRLEDRRDFPRTDEPYPPPRATSASCAACYPRSTRRCAPMAMACKACIWPKSAAVRAAQLMAPNT
jgi:hypothetical protein